MDELDRINGAWMFKRKWKGLLPSGKSSLHRPGRSVSGFVRLGVLRLDKTGGGVVEVYTNECLQIPYL
jgi:hypothetical protein